MLIIVITVVIDVVLVMIIVVITVAFRTIIMAVSTVVARKLEYDCPLKRGEEGKSA